MKKSHSNSIGIKVLSLLLVLAFGATAFVVGPSMFASAPDSIPNEAVNAVKAGGNTAKAAPDSAAAGSGDKITVQKFEIDTIGRLFDKFDVFEKDFYQYIFNNDKGNNKTKINKEKSSPEKKQGVIF